MHLTSTVKSIVLTVTFAAQCVYAKSRNGYAYFDEKFCVLEWIIYLKRLSLIALMLCGVVLYYVPKSRSYARRVCCTLIDTIANGLKFALNTNGTEYEKIKARDENNQNKELRIQELYRKVYEEDTRNHGQKYSNKTNFDNDNHKSIRKHKSKKYRTKHIDKNRHGNAINDVLPKSDAVMVSTINSSQINGEKCEKDNMVILRNTSPDNRITTDMMSSNKLKNNRKFKTVSQKQEDVSDIDTDDKLQNKQNFSHMKSEEITIASQHQSNKDCTSTMNKQMSPCYEELFTKRELCDELRKEKHSFLHDMKSLTHEYYENSPISKVLSRVVKWLFGGCPEASKRHRKVDEVGKEEIFKSANMWLPETSESYLQQ